MTIILFLIDTSASMNQRTYLGTTYLDIAKGAVEVFMKIRQRDPAHRADRYMLLTFEDPPGNVKAGWKESHATFMHELKNLQAVGLSNTGFALKQAFDLLNVNRMSTGIDTYGMGRCPFYFEPAVLITITDGGKLFLQGRVQDRLILPQEPQLPGADLTLEPFRWDQRVFSFVLSLPGHHPVDHQEAGAGFVQPADRSPLNALCEETGGRSYLIASQKALNQCLESVVQKLQGGVVIHFEKIGPDPPTNRSHENGDANDDENGVAKDIEGTPSPPNGAAAGAANSLWHSCRKLIYVQRSAQKGYSVGHWPIPESFWPDLKLTRLPPRHAHPVLKFSCSPCEPMVVENLPFDKYELEPSPLTQFILERKQPHICWQVFVSSSGRETDISSPFGYLKASTNLSCVNLFVMPYNYPVLLPLLDELLKKHNKLKPPKEWRQAFDAYLASMPPYYATPLRRALQRMGVPNLVPDTVSDSCLSYSIMAQLKKKKNEAKVEFERMVGMVGQKVPLCADGIKVVERSNPPSSSILQRRDFDELLESVSGNLSTLSNLRSELKEFPNFSLAIKEPNISLQSFRNPFDIPRKSLISHVAKMRANLLKKKASWVQMQDDDQRHAIPVQEMGNYQDYLKRMPPPLREVENIPVRQHMFGNPFKVNKSMMADEIDEVGNSPQGRDRKRLAPTLDGVPGSPRPKRKPGPLPRDFTINSLRSPLLSPPTSPASSTTGSADEDFTEEDLLLLESEDLEDVQYMDKGEGPVLSEPLSNGGLPLSAHIVPLDATPSTPPHHLHSKDPASPDLARWLTSSRLGAEAGAKTPPPALCNGAASSSVVARLLSSSSPDNNNDERLSPKSSLRHQTALDGAAADSGADSIAPALKRSVLNEVRRPGKNFNALFAILSDAKHPAPRRLLLVRIAQREALRFKRRALAELLSGLEELMEAEGEKEEENGEEEEEEEEEVMS